MGIAAALTALLVLAASAPLADAHGGGFHGPLTPADNGYPYVVIKECLNWIALPGAAKVAGGKARLTGRSIVQLQVKLASRASGAPLVNVSFAGAVFTREQAPLRARARAWVPLHARWRALPSPSHARRAGGPADPCKAVASGKTGLFNLRNSNDTQDPLNYLWWSSAVTDGNGTITGHGANDGQPTAKTVKQLRSVVLFLNDGAPAPSPHGRRLAGDASNATLLQDPAAWVPRTATVLGESCAHLAAALTPQRPAAGERGASAELGELSAAVLTAWSLVAGLHAADWPRAPLVVSARHAAELAAALVRHSHAVASPDGTATPAAGGSTGVSGSSALEAPARSVLRPEAAALEAAERVCLVLAAAQRTRFDPTPSLISPDFSAALDTYLDLVLLYHSEHLAFLTFAVVAAAAHREHAQQGRPGAPPHAARLLEALGLVGWAPPAELVGAARVASMVDHLRSPPELPHFIRVVYSLSDWGTKCVWFGLPAIAELAALRPSLERMTSLLRALEGQGGVGLEGEAPARAGAACLQDALHAAAGAFTAHLGSATSEQAHVRDQAAAVWVNVTTLAANAAAVAAHSTSMAFGQREMLARHPAAATAALEAALRVSATAAPHAGVSLHLFPGRLLIAGAATGSSLPSPQLASLLFSAFKVAVEQAGSAGVSLACAADAAAAAAAAPGLAGAWYGSGDAPGGGGGYDELAPWLVLAARPLAAAGRLLQLPAEHLATAPEEDFGCTLAADDLESFQEAAAWLGASLTHLAEAGAAPAAAAAAAAESGASGQRGRAGLAARLLPPPVLESLLEQQAAVCAELAAAKQRWLDASQGGKPRGILAQQLAALRTAAGPQLAAQLQAFGEAVCAALPLRSACSNPRCANVSGLSEALLARGSACVCAGCRVAHVCGQDCQVAYWRAGHKATCRRLRSTAAGGGAASAGPPLGAAAGRGG
ncbi:hypothetical protein HT031_003094 [Scenedesmus sp. PABB004]|nr:hypothetical protein HT031_003094 [Scenedesmus sp. PABB004]